MRPYFLLLLALAVLAGGVFYYLSDEQRDARPDGIACTMEAKECPDGSYVGRVGPNCEFAQCPPVGGTATGTDEGYEVPTDIEAHIDEKSDLIMLESPEPGERIESPITVTGAARGQWYFEATFPLVLTDWDGRIIAESFAEADGEWMTTEFVPFTGALQFTSPYQEGDPDFMQRGTLILQRSNPSGLPENDDALEIPVRFVPRDGE